MYLLKVFSALTGMFAHRHLLKQMLIRAISLRYKGSFLGLFWTIVQPLLMLFVYSFVFGVIFQPRWAEVGSYGMLSYPLFIFSGLSIFNIFAECVNGSTPLIIHNTNYVKKVVFPLELLPLNQVFVSFIFGSVWLILLLAGVFFVAGRLNWCMLFLIIPLVSLFLFSLGLSYFFSSICVFLRDTQYFLSIVVQVLSFVTPIFFPLSVVPEKYRWILLCNPLAHIVEYVRGITLNSVVPSWDYSLLLILISFAFFYLGLAWFMATKKGFADVL